MAHDTHVRAVAWAAKRLRNVPVGAGAGYHLRDRTGRRIRVAGRRIEERMPTYFSLGATLENSPFDDAVVILFASDWSVRYAYRLPLEAARVHHKRPGRQGCRLMIRGNQSWRRDSRDEALVSPEV